MMKLKFEVNCYCAQNVFNGAFLGPKSILLNFSQDLLNIFFEIAPDDSHLNMGKNECFVFLSKIPIIPKMWKIGHF